LKKKKERKRQKEQLVTAPKEHGNCAIQTRLKKPKGSRGFHLMKRLHAEGFFFKKTLLLWLHAGTVEE
jgi:hypothetical protein